MLVWQFFLPLVVFVVAYWKILDVIRRQSKIMEHHQRRNTASDEPVAGTSTGTTGRYPRGHGVAGKKTRSGEVGGQTGSNYLSQSVESILSAGCGRGPRWGSVFCSVLRPFSVRGLATP